MMLKKIFAVLIYNNNLEEFGTGYFEKPQNFTEVFQLNLNFIRPIYCYIADGMITVTAPVK